MNGNATYRDPKWESISRRATCWVEFLQAADRTTGKPKLIYTLCGEIIKHPNNKNTGSSALAAHLKSMKCKQLARQRGNARQGDLRDHTVVSATRSSPLFGSAG